jgi:hypothetical protein
VHGFEKTGFATSVAAKNDIVPSKRREPHLGQVAEIVNSETGKQGRKPLGESPEPARQAGKGLGIGYFDYRRIGITT